MSDYHLGGLIHESNNRLLEPATRAFVEEINKSDGKECTIDNRKKEHIT
ncbi:hypothetical protein FXV91_17435 [Methanosarcina sp. DH2]|nr:hypothetical protein [Methanosarcina sp. DH2]MCC4771879.1 hypothetical protein [Methanosarcina sp. DH2]